MKTDRRDLQLEILQSDLHQEVVKTAEKLRHVSEYDLCSGPPLQLALLCYALEQSAAHTAGTSITLAGTFRVLREIQEKA